MPVRIAPLIFVRLTFKPQEAQGKENIVLWLAFQEAMLTSVVQGVLVRAELYWPPKL